MGRTKRVVSAHAQGVGACVLLTNARADATVARVRRNDDLRGVTP